jgi:serine/threonine-protein kinase
LAPGALVGGIYRLVRLMGAGGMGEVWEAQHERTKGRVALKVLLAEMGKHEEVLRRFQREVEITSGINHPNIVRVSDADSLPDGRPYLVMEFLEGSDLQKVAGGSAMPLAQVVEIIEQTAMGLHAAHAHSIIHRDLKPANLFLIRLPGTTRPLVKILDFGISKAIDGLSKLTHTHSIMGTPFYMAPEQATGGMTTMDGRADQFSLAAITYELLTGRMAFDGDGMVNVIYKVVNQEPPPFASVGLSLPAGVEHAVRRALSKQANDRFGSVLEFSEALKQAAAGAPVGAAADARPFAATKRSTKLLPTPPSTTLGESAAQIESVRRADFPDDEMARGRGGGKGRGLWIGGAAVAVVAGAIAILALRPASSVKEDTASAHEPPPSVATQPPPAMTPPPPAAAAPAPAQQAPAAAPPPPDPAPKPAAIAAKPRVEAQAPQVANEKPAAEGTSRHRPRPKANGSAGKARQAAPMNDDL